MASSESGSQSSNRTIYTSPPWEQSEKKTPIDEPTTSKDISNDQSPKNQEVAEEKTQETPQTNVTPPEKYPNGLAVLTVFFGLFLAALCVGLDRSIVATAVPKITSDFNSLPDVGWYGSAYLMTTCCLQLFFGKLYAEFSIKWVFLAALFIFEVGSVVCAVAPGSTVLIVGRAVAGIGAAGLVSGAIIIIARSVPIDQRPKYTGALGGAVGLAQVVSPTLGGVFTDKLTWRWCFWINLPLGGVTLLATLFLVSIPPTPRPDNAKPSMAGFLQRFDLKGTLVLIPWVICLLLAVQWGGTQYSWNSWRIILLFVLFGVLFCVWLWLQVRSGDKATVPMRIIKQRSMASATVFMFFAFAAFFIITYYIPIWFQAVRAVSAYHSGINMLALSAALSVTVICSGFVTSKTGYYVPQMIGSTVIASIAVGMVYTFDRETTDEYWVGTLVLLGIGVGLGIQQPLIAAQTVFERADNAIATSVLIFTQNLTGAIFLSVGENVFHNQIVQQVGRAAPQVDVREVIGAGASTLGAVMREKYPQYADAVLTAYNTALQHVFIIPLVTMCMTVFGVVFMEWRSVKKARQAAAAADVERQQRG